MSYAVISLGGKQFKVSEGDLFEIERQHKPIKAAVLMYSNGKDVIMGSDVEVKLNVIEEKRAKKVRVGRFKAKSRYHKVKGHRQPISVIKVDEIVVNKKSTPRVRKVKGK